MDKRIALFSIVLLALLATGEFAMAETYSLVDERYLPLENAYDPLAKENAPITSYSFERLDYLLWNVPAFLRWNDGKRICESMQLMFGRVSGRCFDLPVRTVTVREPDVWVAPYYTGARITTTQARVTLTVNPSRRIMPRVVYVDPVYPPYVY